MLDVKLNLYESDWLSCEAVQKLEDADDYDPGTRLAIEQHVCTGDQCSDPIPFGESVIIPDPLESWWDRIT
jgi:hypothetical protein